MREPKRWERLVQQAMSEVQAELEAAFAEGEARLICRIESYRRELRAKVERAEGKSHYAFLETRLDEVEKIARLLLADRT